MMPNSVLKVEIFVQDDICLLAVIDFRMYTVNAISNGAGGEGFEGASIQVESIMFGGAVIQFNKAYVLKPYIVTFKFVLLLH